MYRSRFISACIAACALAAASSVYAVSTAARVVGHGLSALRASFSYAVGVVLSGLQLFADRNPLALKQPQARTELTARERHDVGMWDWLRPLVARSWRAGALA